jgi:hypothetical protein
MTCTVVGAIGDRLGHTHWQQDHAVHGPGGRLSAYRTHEYVAEPMSEYAGQQPGHVSVDFDHDGHEVGHVTYLRRDAERLWAVAVLDDYDAGDLARLGPLKLSASTVRHRNRAAPLELRSVSIIPAIDAAVVGLPPLEVIDGAPRHHWRLPSRHPRRRLLRTAHEYDARRWRRSDPNVIDDPPLATVEVRGEGGGQMLATAGGEQLLRVTKTGQGRWVEGAGVLELERWPAGQGARILAVR